MTRLSLSSILAFLSLALLCLLTGMAYGQTVGLDTVLVEDLESYSLAGKTPLILIHGIHGNQQQYSADRCSPDDITSLNRLYWNSFLHYFYKGALKDKYKVYRFHYVSDLYEVTQIGAALANDISASQIAGRTDVVIIAHSMGGLVARSYMQEWGGDVNVAKLITLATPHHGSPGASASSRDDLAINANARDAAYLPSWFNHPLFGPLNNWADAVRSAGWYFWWCSPGILTLHSDPNRSDLRWDNFDSVFNTPANDINTWLFNLNNQSTTTEGKTITYYGYIDPESGSYQHLLEQIYCHKWDCGPLSFVDKWSSSSKESVKLKVASILLNKGLYKNGHEPYPRNDGLVPVPSAGWDGHTVAKQVECEDFDHLDMKDGGGKKTCQNGLSLFDSISVDLGVEPAGVVEVRLSNIDDNAFCYVNGVLTLTTGYLGDTDFVDVTPYLHEGDNTIRFTLLNGFAGWTYRFEIKENGRITYSRECGQASIIGCKNNDLTLGIVYDKTVKLKR